jgi:ParB family chromosome partitioning protein
MKRQALGKGLGSLIPDKTGLEALAPSRASSTTAKSGAVGKNRQSAADVLAKTRELQSPAAGSTGRAGLRPVSAADIPPPEATRPAGASHEGESAPSGAAGEATPRASGAPASMGPSVGSSVGILPPAAAGAGLLQWLDIDRIEPNPRQPRRQFPEQELEELAASIRSSGVLQPIIVRRTGAGYGLVAGERRWRAAQRAGLHKVPALLRDIPDDRLIEIALIENIQRQDLNPIEEARAFAALIDDHGLSQADVAERVGRQRSTIANALRLLSLSPRVQAMTEAGTLSAGHARALAALPGHRAQDLGAEIVTRRALSVRETESWVARHTEDVGPHEAAPTRRSNPNIRAAEEGLQRRLGTRVKIVAGRGDRGLIQIEYYSAAELDRIYERLIKA